MLIDTTKSSFTCPFTGFAQVSELPEHAAGREPRFGDREVVVLRVQEAVECLLDALADHPHLCKRFEQMRRCDST